jgi:ubiquinone/menaquinone biosynthesis C-methylase UbiE
MTEEARPTTPVEIPAAARELMTPERLSELTFDPPVVLHGPHKPSNNRRFEGLYGGVYNRVIQSAGLRKAVFSVWGSADPLYELDSFVSDAVEAARAASQAPVLVDLPSGGGTLLPFFAREGLEGTVIEVDLAAAMLRRAVALEQRITSDLRTIFLRADALDLPLKARIADVVVSINGLHVVTDHRGFLEAIARITKPNGELWLITPVDGPSPRSRAILAAARRLGITPGAPPTLSSLYRFLDEVGFTSIRSYGGNSIAGLSAQRV